MKKILFTLFYFLWLNSFSQVLKNYVFNSIDTFIEIEMKDTLKMEKDSLLLDVSLSKIGKNEEVLNLKLHPFNILNGVKVDSIYIYRGIKTIIDIEKNEEIKQSFHLLVENKKFVEQLKNKKKKESEIAMTYHPIKESFFQFNTKRELYLIYSIKGKVYFNSLKGKVKFSKKLKFIPTLEEQNEIKLSQ